MQSHLQLCSKLEVSDETVPGTPQNVSTLLLPAAALVNGRLRRNAGNAIVCFSLPCSLQCLSQGKENKFLKT